MLKDAFNIPPKYSADVKVYTANTAVNLMGFQVWQKPKGASLVTMITIAGGGGGGGGFSRVAGADGGGGAGGACSGITRFMCPAIFLPDLLYIQVGAGGVGGAASSNGTAGLNSYVLTSKTNNLPNIICYSGINAPGGGGAGTATAGGTGGTIPTIATTQPFNACGFWFSTVGVVGGAGGAHTGAAGANVSAWASGALTLSPGAGGGGSTGVNFAGGNQSPASVLVDIGSQGYYPNATGGIAAGGATLGGNGSAGVNRITPLFCSGGAGGGTFDAGQGGHGGKGGYGCGGGGGAAGTTGGRGGNGGSGLVVIVTI